MISSRAAIAESGAGAGERHAITRSMAFMNQKGGVGKTTSVVNLAAAVARRGRSVLVVDLDPQAHATLHLGVDPAGVGRSVYDVLLHPLDPGGRPGADAAESALCDVGPNLGLLPAVTDLAAVETELAHEPDRLSRLAGALEPLKARYEFIMLDCPPSLGLLTLNGLVAAKEIIMPMQAHFLALQGVGKLLETVALVARSVNPKLRVSGVILCMHEEQTRHAREVVEDIRSFFADQRDADAPWAGARVYRPAVRRNIKLAECPSFGQTIFDYAPDAPGAKDYAALGDQVIAEWDRVLARLAGATPTPDAAPAEAGDP